MRMRDRDANKIRDKRRDCESSKYRVDSYIAAKSGGGGVGGGVPLPTLAISLSHPLSLSVSLSPDKL